MAQLRLQGIVLLTASLFHWVAFAHADSMGYSETFVLSQNRAKALKQLTPKTIKYYYYRALHDQNEGRLDKVDQLLEAWQTHFPQGSRRLREIKHRQALLRYTKTPQATVEYLRKRLGVNFSHAEPVPPTSRRVYPSRIDLDTKWASLVAAWKGGVSYSDIGKIDAATLYHIVNVSWGKHLAQGFLRQLERPDHPLLVKLVERDLTAHPNETFGYLPIHKKMLLSQLRELLKRRPALRNDTAFVETYLSRLWPSNDRGGSLDDTKKDAYLARLWAFVKTLSTSHNGLKRHVLYHMLKRAQQKGAYPTSLLLRYMRLPRAAHETNTYYLRSSLVDNRHQGSRKHYHRWTQLKAHNTDESLVREYLERLFQRGVKRSTFRQYLRPFYLRRDWIQAMLYRDGGQKRWTRLLTPGQYEALKERVELRFAPTNKRSIGTNDTIHLRLRLKNVPTLLLKVYRINSRHYHQTADDRSANPLKLDGMMAHRERRYRYDIDPIRRYTRNYRFPKLRKRGIYVIDCIGSGKSSRAIIHKGRLFATQKLTAAGHQFTIFDESGHHLPTARVWLGSQLFRPDAKGHVYLPMTNQPGSKTVLLQADDFYYPYTFRQRKETYALQAGFYVDREALLKGQRAQLLMRPQLTVTGVPTSASLLSHVRLQIKAIDRFGIQTLKTIVNPALHDDKESRIPFVVPPNLSTMTFQLTAQVFNLSQQKAEALVQTKTIQINEIEQSSQLEAWHLQKLQGGYVLSLRDKAGGGMAHRVAEIKVWMRGFRRPQTWKRQTDAKGRITLSGRVSLTKIQVHSRRVYGKWTLQAARVQQPENLYGNAASTLQIPYIGHATKPLRNEWSLLEIRGDNTYTRDAFDKLKVQDGYLHIEGLAPGDYQLHHRPTNETTHIYIAQTRAGSSTQSTSRSSAAGPGWLAGRYRILPAPQPPRMHITRLNQTSQHLEMKLQHTTKTTRVHVLATRFVPRFDLYQSLQITDHPTLTNTKLEQALSQYQLARPMSKEMQYILARRYAKKYPGNMLPRPGLLLQPWARQPDFGSGGVGLGGVGTGGGGYGSGGRKRIYGHGGMLRTGRARLRAYPPNLDYLRYPSQLLANLQPDANGVVRVPLQLAQHHPHLHIVATDDHQTVYRQWILPDSPIQLRDIKMKDALDPTRHFAEQTQIAVVSKGRSLRIAPRQFARYTAINSLPKAFALLQTINNTKEMQQFRFILRWHRMTKAEKQTWYSRYACHELNFFLYHKDPAFFAAVVRPYLHNKMAKTFLDRWMLKQDLKRYLQPWRYARLNVAERILLGRRLPQELAAMRRHIRDWQATQRPTREKAYKLLLTALQNHRLDLASLAYANAKPTQTTSSSSNPSTNKDASDEPQSAADALQRRINTYKRLLEGQAQSISNADKQRLKDLLQLHLSRLHLQRLYRPAKETQELEETHYYKRALAEQDASLIQVNPFWRDVANHQSGPFVSAHLAYASNSFAEMMLALALLDLPLDHNAITKTLHRDHITLSPRHAAIVYIQKLQPTKAPKQRSQLLVRQRCFPANQRYQHIHHKTAQAPATTHYEVHTAIGCEIIVTNPQATTMALDLLLQIPDKSLPLRNTKRTDSRRIRLGAYRTYQHSFYFTFPQTGTYTQFPIHVSHRGKLIDFAKAITFDVRQPQTKIDKTNWYHIVDYGTSSQILKVMRQRNLHSLPLDALAWRMKRKAFFLRTIKLLRQRHIYNQTLWSYGLYHNHAPTIRSFLQMQKAFIKTCGMVLDSPLLRIEPVTERLYEHLEYNPLYNARAHRFGKKRSISYTPLYQQYKRLLRTLRYKKTLGDADRMALTYYLLLQDRIREALAQFAKVNPRRLRTQLQYDYFRVYLAFYERRFKRARRIAMRYRTYPVLRWRRAFVTALQQLNELRGSPTSAPTSKPETLQAAALIGEEGSFDFKIEANTIRLEHQHIKTFRIHYHVMNVELLFSQKPFAQTQTGPFAMLKPQLTQQVKARRRGYTRQRIPRQMRSKNMIVEVVSAGKRKTRHYYANQLHAQIMPRIGQLRILHRRSRRPLTMTYIKVYAKDSSGNVSFYKDGYTDLRGRFDYATLAPDSLNKVKRFAILIANPRYGATTREVAPPNL